MARKIYLFLVIILLVHLSMKADDVRSKYNFNSQWLYSIGDKENTQFPQYADSGWTMVTLPHAFNEDEAFKLSFDQLTDTVEWYRKHFKMQEKSKGKKKFKELEGVR